MVEFGKIWSIKKEQDLSAGVTNSLPQGVGLTVGFEGAGGDLILKGRFQPLTGTESGMVHDAVL